MPVEKWQGFTTTLTKQFQMSIHCQPPACADRYGTFGTPIGIFVTLRRGPADCLQDSQKFRPGLRYALYSAWLQEAPVLPTIHSMLCVRSIARPSMP